MICSDCQKIADLDCLKKSVVVEVNLNMFLSVFFMDTVMSTAFVACDGCEQTLLISTDTTTSQCSGSNLEDSADFVSNLGPSSEVNWNSKGKGLHDRCYALLCVKKI